MTSSNDDKDQDIHGLVLPVSAEMDITTVHDNAKADGSDYNIVNVVINNAGDAIDHVPIRFEITSGNAIFKDNGKKILTKNTNVALSLSVKFSDTDGEKGTIKAYPVSNMKLTKEVPYTFISVVASLTLNVTHDNAIANGIATNTAVAALLDSEGKGVANQTLLFTLPAGGTAKFSDGSKQLSGKTDPHGQVSVQITDVSLTDITANLVCTFASLKQNRDVHFKGSLPEFTLVATKDTAKVKTENNDDHGIVRATITPPAGSTPQNYIVRFTPSNSNASGRGRFRISSTTSRQFTDSGIYEAPVSVSGTTNVDANVWDLDTTAPSKVVADIQATLLTADKQSLATSQTVQVTFIPDNPPPPPPPPPPPADNYLLVITALRDGVPAPGPYRNPPGLGNIARVRLTNNGKPVSDVPVSCSFYASAPVGNYKFANDDAQLRQTMSGNGTHNIVMRTDDNGEFTVTLALWDPCRPRCYTGIITATYSNANPASRQFHWT
ncbi:hypothetical protein H7Q97_14415 [Ochrobactrum sp. CM-21-5]|nr:hypothetical protein [Ochrobactrum sp. CM-21-5]MBC2886584.1 hypothetical protein [Ochrobactrum sp. CM-21-5]